MRFLSLIFLALWLLSLTTAGPILGKRSFTGKATFYTAGKGACGQVNSNSDLIAALNQAQWGSPSNANSSPYCGKTISIQGPKGSVTVTVMDLCPSCGYGDLDLTPTAFDAIGDPSQGVVSITWQFADGSPPPPPPPPTPTTPPPPPPSPTTPPPSPTTTQQPTSTVVSSTVSTPTPQPSRNIVKIAYSFLDGTISNLQS